MIDNLDLPSEIGPPLIQAEQLVDIELSPRDPDANFRGRGPDLGFHALVELHRPRVIYSFERQCGEITLEVDGDDRQPFGDALLHDHLAEHGLAGTGSTDQERVPTQ